MFKKMTTAILTAIISSTFIFSAYAAAPPLQAPPELERPRQEPAIYTGGDTFTTIRFAIGETTFTVNGAIRQMEAAPFIANDRTMVPVGVIAEALGAVVGWDGPTQTVSIDSDDASLRLVIGVPLPNDMGIPMIVADRTFVPIAYVSDMMNAATRWDEDARAVYIVGGTIAEPIEPPPIDTRDNDEPSFRVGTVRIVSGGTEHQPHVHFFHGAMRHNGMMMSASGLQLQLSEIFDELPVVQYAEDFQVLVDGEDAAGISYSLYGTNFEIVTVNGQDLRNMEELTFPEDEEEYILVINITWSSSTPEPGGFNEFVSNGYIFRIIK